MRKDIRKLNERGFVRAVCRDIGEDISGLINDDSPSDFRAALRLARDANRLCKDMENLGEEIESAIKNGTEAAPLRGELDEIFSEWDDIIAKIDSRDQCEWDTVREFLEPEGSASEAEGAEGAEAEAEGAEAEAEGAEAEAEGAEAEAEGADDAEGDEPSKKRARGSSF
jgi:hypothetical protein